jgi:hypothetical protein
LEQTLREEAAAAAEAEAEARAARDRAEEERRRLRREFAGEFLLASLSLPSCCFHSRYLLTPCVAFSPYLGPPPLSYSFTHCITLLLSDSVRRGTKNPLHVKE